MPEVHVASVVHVLASQRAVPCVQMFDHSLLSDSYVAVHGHQLLVPLDLLLQLLVLRSQLLELLVLAQPGGALLNKGLHLIDVAGEIARGEVVVAAGVIGALSAAIVVVEVLLVLV